MKKLFLILTVLFVFIPFSGKTFAVTPPVLPTKVPTSAADSQSLSDKIDHLKSLLASKVAELKLVDKRGIVGSVQDVTNTQIKLLDNSNNIRIVNIDEFTKFASGSASGKFGISDIKKGMRISTLGLYNKESRIITAHEIDTIDFPIYINGTITSVDKDNFLLTIQQGDGTTEKVDIDNSSKIITYDENLDPTKTGFSKITAGVRTIVVGFQDPKEKSRMTASRILLFTSLLKDPKVNVTIQATTAPTAAPTAALKRTVTRTP